MNNAKHKLHACVSNRQLNQLKAKLLLSLMNIFISSELKMKTIHSKRTWISSSKKWVWRSRRNRESGMKNWTVKWRSSTSTISVFQFIFLYTKIPINIANHFRLATRNKFIPFLSEINHCPQNLNAALTCQKSRMPLLEFETCSRIKLSVWINAEILIKTSKCHSLIECFKIELMIDYTLWNWNKNVLGTVCDGR